MEKAPHRAGTVLSPGRKPLQNSPARTPGPPRPATVPNLLHCLREVQTKYDTEDTSEEDATPKKA